MVAINAPTQRYMSSPVHQLAPTATLQQAADTLRKLRISSLAVTEGDSLRGVISRTDLLRVGLREAVAANSSALLELPDGNVGDAMSRDVLTVSLNDPLSKAASMMVEKEFHRVFATNGERLVGVVSTRDVMQALSDHRVAKSIEDVMSSPTFTVDASESIAKATQKLELAGISGLVVVEDEWPVGLFTQLEALQSRRMNAEVLVDELMNAAFVCMPTTTTIHRAAAQAVALRVRRIIAVRQREMQGILTGIDFARVAAGRA